MCNHLIYSLFKGKWRLYGGWNGLNSPVYDYNTQYSSPDLVNWTKERNADWNPSHGFGLAHDEVNDILYKVGSDGMPNSTDADRSSIYKTTDGVNWTLVSTQSVLSRIVLHFATCKGSDIYVGGGQILGTGSSLSASSVNTKVWKSTDGGVTFTEIASGLTHLGGNMYGQCIWSKTYQKFIAVCCPSKYDDVGANRTYSKAFYTSDDCITWTQQTDFYGLGRQYGNLVDDGQLVWLINGSVYNGDSGNNTSEAWYYNGANWARIQAKPLSLTHATGVAANNGTLAIMCGNMYKNVYYLEKY